MQTQRRNRLGATPNGRPWAQRRKIAVGGRRVVAAAGAAVAFHPALHGRHRLRRPAKAPAGSGGVSPQILAADASVISVSAADQAASPAETGPSGPSGVSAKLSAEDR